MNLDDEQLRRDLAALVRAAADEVPVGDVPHLPDSDLNTRFCVRWDEAAHQQLGTKMDEFIATLIGDLPPLRTASGADILAEIGKAYELIRAAPPPRTSPVFLTPKQFDLLKQHTAPTSPYDTLGVIAPLFGVPVVVTPERTRWRRFRAWLRRWRWWR
jgi:hypothetical protein